MHRHVADRCRTVASVPAAAFFLIRTSTLFWWEEQQIFVGGDGYNPIAVADMATDDGDGWQIAVADGR